MLRRVLEKRDEGSIAVMAAVVAPVVLLVIALALATLVWAASETETQNAADGAAVQAAASALLLDLRPPTAQLPTLPPTTYPTLAGAVPASLVPSLPVLDPCETVGNPIGAVQGLLGTTASTVTTTTTDLLGLVTTVVTTVLTPILPSDIPPAFQTILEKLPDTNPPTACAAITAPLLPAMPSTTAMQACDAAKAAMGSASYATRFYSGPSGQEIPTCPNGRVRVGLATGSPLIGFGTSSINAAGSLTIRFPTGITAVQNALAPAGVRLDSALPNALCPQVDVEVDQPVREPVFDRSSTPNGRASARRVIKNAVVVPVFNGLAVSSATLPVTSLTGAASFSGAVSVPAQNLNPALLEVRDGTLGLLDSVENRINALTATVPGVELLNGTTQAVSASTGLPAPTLSANLGSVNLLKCLKDSVADVFNPPGGDPPATVQEIFAAAAAAGEPVNLIQVGAKACTGATSAASAFSCVQAATGAAAGVVENLTGVYDVPFFDVTPVLLEDVGRGNYRALPVHATQAAGAFRANLIRSANDSRYVAGP